MAKIEKFRKISTAILKEISGGTSQNANCKWAIITCGHDIALSGFGTSDPGSACAYMRRVCKKISSIIK